MSDSAVDWTPWRWSPERTYPESLQTKVHVKLRSGEVLDHVPLPVLHWHDETPEFSSWFNTHEEDDEYGEDIMAYRVVT